IIGDEDFARMTLTPETTPAIANEAQIESDLDDLFGENDASTEFLGNIADETEDEDVVSGLETLFATSPNVAIDRELEADFDHYFSQRDAVPPTATNAIPTPATTPAKAHTPAPAPAIAFFPDLNDLDALLTDSKPQPTNWQSLESLVQDPITTPVFSFTSPAPPSQIEILSSAKDTSFDDLEALLELADQTMGGPPTVNNSAQNQARSRAPKINAFEQTMRIPVKQLDNLSNLMGELVVNRNSLEESQEKLRQFLENLVGQVQRLSDIGGRMQDLYERSLLERSLLASRSQTDSRNTYSGLSNSIASNSQNQDYDPLEMDQFTGFHLLSQEMIELIVRVRESSSDIEFLVDDTEQVARNLRQVSTQLQEGLTKSRMIPFSQAADRLVRPVRDISNKLQKKAILDVEGRDALIDKMILEQLYDPLTHLINNAITHGIERPEIRTQQGKAATGKISLKVFVQGNQIVLSISDDGAGIDPDVIVRKAIEKGLVAPGKIRNLSEQEIYDFIFHPGFTTKDTADDFAGRGVGMDVVRTALGAIRGTITIDSTLGRGTKFIIRLPLTLNICKALCCLNRHTRIALPMDGVEDMQDFNPNQIEVEEGRKYIRWRNTRLRLHPLNSLLAHHRRIGRQTIYGSTSDPDQIPVVILRSAGNVIALQVDQVIGEQEIVIKQIEGAIPKPAGISGATVLGDGTIMPVADVLELIELAAQGRIRAKLNTWQETLPPTAEVYQSVNTEPLVLIVDDSITVRELLSISFTKTGYRVEQARDGQEAWDKLSSGLPCDLVFCDIEMPRIDGLELLSRIQKNPDLAKIPVAMLTSRGADRHRQMAAQLGASAYFTKPYLEEALLDAAQKMRQGEVLLAGSTRERQVVEAPPAPAPQQSPPPAQQLEPQPSTHGTSATPAESINFEPSVRAFATQATFKALIIDDSVTVRELLAITFQNAGYRVEKARDGQDALDKLLATPDFDVAFCDIEMPRIDGLELLNRVQQHPELKDIPIAMLTSRGAERHRKIAAERGAKAYFTKPYMEDNLLAAAKRLIQGEILLDENGKVK
ncbi:MAG: hybrid sensor histidine kinase/response regulator, partial [Limnothrix sp.]